MNVKRESFEDATETVGYLLFGLVVTALVALVSPRLLHPVVQPAVYHATYLALGPSEATATAGVVHMIAVAIVGIAVPTVIAEYHGSGLEHDRELLGGPVGMLDMLVLFALVSVVTGPIDFLPAVFAFVVVVASVPSALRVSDPNRLPERSKTAAWNRVTCLVRGPGPIADRKSRTGTRFPRRVERRHVRQAHSCRE